jgi:hypothetical protein
MLVQALLGLEVDGFSRTVRLRPSLPGWLSRISVRNMCAADRRVDFDVVRDGHRVVVHVVDDGGLRIEAREASDPGVD